MKSEILYIQTYLEEESINYVNQKSEQNSQVSVAGSKYANLIRKGLKNQDDVSLSCIFVPSLGAYPHSKIKYYKTPKICRHEKGNYISFINFAIIKQISTALQILVYASIWLFKKRFSQNRYIITSSLQLPFFLGILPLKLFGVKVISFVPDLPQYQYNYTPLKSRVEKMCLPVYQALSNWLYSTLNFYVFITSYMVNRFPKRPYSIMEGLVDTELQRSQCPNHESNLFCVMYAGALYATMGVGNLLDAIKLMDDPEMEFWFFGVGDMVSTLTKAAADDARIKYFGNLPNDVVLEYEAKANLLINPRLTANEFTKYSFPSKLMEYMFSATPTLTTRLAGIPEEYYDKMFYIDNESSQGMCDAMVACRQIPREKLIKFGQAARNYVIENKNCDSQLKRIVQHIKTTFE